MRETLMISVAIVLFFTTCCIYGEMNQAWMNEYHPLIPEGQQCEVCYRLYSW